MKTLSTIVAFSIALASASVSAPAARTPDLRASVNELLGVDRGFADAAAKTDMITGISAMFDAEVIGPIPGGKIAHGKADYVEAMRSNPANSTARTTWHPVKAGISADGQQGFTLGYMDITDQGKPEPRLSKYLAYWVRKPEGWRVVAYKRETRPEGPVSLKMIEPTLPDEPAVAPLDAATLRQYEADLKQREAAMSAEARTAGGRSVFEKFSTPQSVSLGSQAEVTIGIEPMATLSDAPMDVNWAADGARVAASGDLGFTWGIMRPGGEQAAGQPPALFPFFAVWRRADASEGWRYIAR